MCCARDEGGRGAVCATRSVGDGDSLGRGDIQPFLVRGAVRVVVDHEVNGRVGQVTLLDRRVEFEVLHVAGLHRVAEVEPLHVRTLVRDVVHRLVADVGVVDRQGEALESRQPVVVSGATDDEAGLVVRISVVLREVRVVRREDLERRRAEGERLAGVNLEGDEQDVLRLAAEADLDLIICLLWPLPADDVVVAVRALRVQDQLRHGFVHIEGDVVGAGASSGVHGEEGKGQNGNESHDVSKTQGLFELGKRIFLRLPLYHFLGLLSMVLGHICPKTLGFLPKSSRRLL